MQAGSLKRPVTGPSMNLATFRAQQQPLKSSDTSSSSSSPTVSVAPIPPPLVSSTSMPPRPGILKPPSINLGDGATPPPPSMFTTSPPDVTPSSASVCAVPNCSAQCNSGPRPAALIRTGSDHHEEDGFNSSCQQCLAERAAAGGVNTVISVSSQASRPVHQQEDQSKQQQQLDITSGLEFTSLSSDDGLDSLTANGEETRGRRLNEDPEPGRTYECELWCKDASRQVAGCIGITLLALGYAALGAVLFMAIETRTGFPLNHNNHEEDMSDNSVVVVEPPTVMNVTVALLDMPIEVKTNVDRARGETVTKLWQVTEKMNILYPENWTRIAAEEILWFQDQLTKALMVEFSARSRTQASQQQQYFYDHMQRGGGGSGPFHSSPGEWTFGRGLLYSVSLLTTVGCGTDWAVSPLSRLLTVMYLVIGAPIMYLYLTTTGGLLTKAICFSCHRLTCKRRPPPKNNVSSRRSSTSGTPSAPHKELTSGGPRRSASYVGSTEKLAMGGKRSTWQTRGSLAAQSHNVPVSTSIHMSNSNGSVNTIMSANVVVPPRPNVAPPIVACVLVLTCYVLSGAAIVAEGQKWTYRDSLYFCFVSLTTVGFGGVKITEPNVCALYLFVGITLLSTCGHILLQEVVFKLKRYKCMKRRHRSLMESFEGLSKGDGVGS